MPTDPTDPGLAAPMTGRVMIDDLRPGERVKVLVQAWVTVIGVEKQEGSFHTPDRLVHYMDARPVEEDGVYAVGSGLSLEVTP